MLKAIRKRKEEKARKKRWEIEQGRIVNLKKSLIKLGDFPDDSSAGFQYAVDFFQIISSFQDEGYISSAPAELKNSMAHFNGHIKNAGRDKYGINRTKVGEEVTLDNTYWGNVFGLYTKTSRFWSQFKGGYPDFIEDWVKAEHKQEYKGRYPDGISTKEVILEFQVKPFVESHRVPMIKLSKKLLAF